MNVQPIATKFVKWDIKPLETLSCSKVYELREKLNRGEKLSREDKNWLAMELNNNVYFKASVPQMGYRFDFTDAVRKYLVKQYGSWQEYYAPDKTSLRATLYGRIIQIVEIN